VNCDPPPDIGDESTADRDEVAGAMADIAQRLRYSIGEYQSDPTAD
jgi:hypothetical protein